MSVSTDSLLFTATTQFCVQVLVPFGISPSPAKAVVVKNKIVTRKKVDVNFFIFFLRRIICAELFCNL